MKAISLQQPWGQAIFTPMPAFVDDAPAGAMIKQWETRKFQPAHRGKLLIHTSLSDKMVKGIEEQWPFKQFLPIIGTLVYGAVIGVVDLVEVVSTQKWREDIFKPEFKYMDVEKAFGDYSGGRYAWKLINPVLFDVPMNIRGALSVWDVSREVLRAHFEKNPPTSEKLISVLPDLIK